MRIKRFRAFIIDFIVMALAFYLINVAVPKTRSVKALEAEQNEITENYMQRNITFEDYFTEYGEVVYNLDKEQKIVNIIYLIFILCYFVLLPFLWKGRTLGTYLNGIQVERFDKGYLFLHQLFIRNFIVIGLGYLLIRTLGIYILPSKYYFLVISIVGLLQIVLAVFSANMIMFTKNKRGLQDILSNTEMAKIIKVKNHQ